jgi:hypothetical protein
MKKGKKQARSASRINLIALISLAFVLAGQSLLYTSPQDQTKIPAAFWIALGGAAVFAFGWLRGKPGGKAKPANADRAALWIGTGALFSILATFTMLLFQRRGAQNYIPVVSFWFFAMISLFAAFSPKLPRLRAVRAWAYEHRYELIGIGLATLLAFWLRFYKLGSIPRVVNGDEGLVGLNAQQTHLPFLANPFALWENFGALYLQSINLALNLFGVSPFSLRLMAAIGGTLAIPALYLFTRQVAGKRVALVAALLLAFSHTHIHFSRTVAVAYVQGTWLIPLEAFFFLRGLATKRSWMMAASAILLALHFSVYLDSQIALAALTGFSLVAAIFLHPWMRGRWRQLAAFYGSFAILILPEMVYASRRPGLFFDRLNALGSFQTGWITERMSESGQTLLPVLWERATHAFLSLIFYPAFDFYGSPIPMLSLVSGSLFLIGLIFTLTWARRPSFLLLNSYFWTGTLAVGLFAIPPSADSYRMLVVLPAAFLMAAVGLEQSLQAFQMSWSKARLAYSGAVVAVLSTLLVFNIWAYFGQFAGQCLYGRDSTPARFASYLGNYLATLEPFTEGYLLSDETFFYGSHASVDFLSRHHPVTNIPEEVSGWSAPRYAVLIATPNRIDELKTWVEENPGGVLTFQYDCGTPILMAYEIR